MQLRSGILVAALALGSGCGPTAPGGYEDAAPAGDAPDDAASGFDAPVPPDAAPDATPGNAVTCEPCESNADCADGWLCILTGAGHLCLPECSVVTPDCPDDFTCAGVNATYCAPVDGVCCIDADDDGWGDGVACFGPDCDDADPAVNPGAAEICDTLDNDCDPGTGDGEADPAVGAPCDGPDTDMCEEGTASCAPGGLACDDATGDNPELCNGLDDDCVPASVDGSGDPGLGIACDGPDGDLCQEGTSSCAGGMLSCNDATGTTLDFCNGADDDCDSATADGAGDPAVGVACDGSDTDLCAEGATACSGGGLLCGDATGNSIELCNGVDDDCNGSTADGSGDPLIGLVCDGADGDTCNEGVRICSGGVNTCSDATGTTFDLCNAVDDDCNPGTPDGADDPAMGAACDGPDADSCPDGILSCVGGAPSCSDGPGASPDLCNGIDDDCNPLTADGSADPGVGVSCDGGDTDLCNEGSTSCSGGGVVCGDTTGNNVELCNGLNDDCNASTSDGSADPGIGVACDGADTDLCAEGVTSCGGGGIVCGDTTGDNVELCNGLNDDCNGSTADGAADPAVGVPCDGGDTDLCAEGTTTCSGGGILCGDATGNNIEMCNGADDDCNSSTADGSGDPLIGLVCDGADGDSCNEGITTCAAGVNTCSDSTGTTFDLCNGVDDDCNAATPDGADDPAMGAACDGPDGDSCPDGILSCVGGAPSCSDGPGTSPDLCNGIDDDCNPLTADGSADPGVGVACDGGDTDLCNEGSTSCSGGGIVCGDTTGDNVELCNGLNDDCNGSTADGSADPGVGVSCDGGDTDLCQEGTTSCAGGGVSCGDTTGNNIELCNGLNDDCNATTADGSGDPAVGQVCDGPDGDLCTEGVTSCGGGGVSCGDTTGTTFDLCNGVNDDCNPATDDGADDPAVGAPCDGADGDLCAEGAFTCSGGGLSCNDMTGTTTDLCNGLNDDCDLGSADGSEDPMLGVPCDGPDSDACLEGVLACPSGTLSCNDASPDDIEICDGLDNDCDVTIDEGFDTTGDPFNCGVCGNVCSGLCCSSSCIPSSTSNCGACGHACAPGMLIINELMMNPAAVADAQGEWIEVYNPNAWAIDLRGFVLDDLGSDNHTITSTLPVIVPANSLAVLGINANSATNGGVTAIVYQYASFVLGNDGDEAILIAHGTELDRLEYNTTFDPNGRSKELSVNHQSYTQNDTLTNWCQAVTVWPGSAGDFGTPGALNACAL